VVGSLTHCPGYRACAVARAASVAAIGIDAEPCHALPGGLLTEVATRPERRHLATLSAGVPWDLLLFCAKEAAYKAWCPLTGGGLSFAGVRIEFTTGGSFAGVRIEFTTGGSFTARLTGDAGPPVTALAGCWLVRDGLAVTAVTAPGAPRGVADHTGSSPSAAHRLHGERHRWSRQPQTPGRGGAGPGAVWPGP
jgi:4'-phosphopantetheinyl transferase EntD